VVLYAISNHFSSTPDARVGQRTEQARYNAALAQAISAQRGPLGERVLIGGDLNVFPRPDDPFAPGDPLYPSDQLGPLYERGLRNLYDVLVREVPAGAYSYVFEGQAQTLDQLFVSRELRSELAGVRAAHINADWPADFDGDGPRGTSDHDPPVARFER
jgi:predicted extracellular nuclease